MHVTIEKGEHTPGSSSHADMSGLSKLLRSMRCWRFGVGIATVVIFPPLYVWSMITIYFSFGGLQGKAGWFFMAFFSIVLISLLTLFAYRCYRSRCGCYASSCKVVIAQKDLEINTEKKSYTEVSTNAVVDTGGLNRKNLSSKLGSMPCLYLYAVSIVLMLTEVLFHFCFPSVSILPLEWSAQDITAAGLEADLECNFAQTWSTVTDFYAQSDIDLSRVRVVVGGAPANFGILKALVIENTIYVYGACASARLLVHEMVHVWQHQTRFWFRKGVVSVWEFAWKQMTGFDDLYDYGGMQGLKAVLDDDPKASILVFGPEQQAEIVADYYEMMDLSLRTSSFLAATNQTNLTVSMFWSSLNNNSTRLSEYYALLRTFAQQVVRTPQGQFAKH